MERAYGRKYKETMSHIDEATEKHRGRRTKLEHSWILRENHCVMSFIKLTYAKKIILKYLICFSVSRTIVSNNIYHIGMSQRLGMVQRLQKH